MPRRPCIPCKHPECAALVPYSRIYCDKHKQVVQSQRKTTAERGYGSKWQRARGRFLKANPLCVYCKEQSRLVKAEVVDYIQPHRGDEELFWDERNWQSLCKKCHDRKTMTVDRKWSINIS